MNAKVSVIIPTYNYAHFLDDCLNSVFKQSYRNLEIIVVDDGSKDHTKNLVSKYGKKINYIYQKNSGLSSARNMGIKNSTGDYLQFLDSDDLLHPYAIEYRINKFKLNPEHKLLVSKNKTFSIVKGNSPKILGSWPLQRENLDIHLCYFNIAPPHAFLMSSEVIENVGLFDTTLNACEDYDYWLRVIAKGFTPKFSNMGLVYYRKHKSSMSSNKNNQYHHDALLHIRLFKLLYEDKKNNIENNLASSAAFVCGLLTTLSRLRENSEEHIDELMNLVRPSFDNLFSNLNDQRLIYNYEFMYYLMKLNELSILYRLDKNIYDYLVILNEEYLKRYHMENNFKILIQSIFSQNIKNINKSNLLSLFMQQSMTHFKNFLQNS